MKMIAKLIGMLSVLTLLVSCGGGGSASFTGGGTTGGTSGGGTGSTAGVVSSVTLSATPSTIALGQQTTLLALVKDANGDPVINVPVSFSVPSNNSGGSFSSVVAITCAPSSFCGTPGGASITYTGGVTSGTDTLSATSNGKSGSAQVIVIPNTALLGSLTVTSTSSSLTADGTSFTQIRATVLDINKSPVAAVPVNFATTSGSLSASSAVTNSSGIAQVNLTSATKAGTANVTASTGGFNQNVLVPFVAGSPVAAQSSITASPSSLPADGTSTTTVTVLLADTNGNLAPDGTSVSLSTTAGSITSANPATTAQGRATFTLQAPSTTATATLTAASVSGLSGQVNFGSVSSTGDPANIIINVGKSQVSVAGVGQTANTSISIQVRDSVGNAIKESGYNNAALNNLRVTILSQPSGGEYVSGTDASGNVVTTQSGPILVRTLNGAITLNFQSGTLPGVVEIKVEALLAANGTTLANPVTAIAPELSIASGPPNSIVLTYPVINSIENLGGGVYRRVGTALVTDRYGNAVPDGTAISLGILDSVIAMGSDGATSAASALLTSASANFLTASITRNGTARTIQANDRILLDTAPVNDKSRFVNTITGATDITAQSNFLNTSNGLNYVVGASLLGADIFGVDPVTSTLTKGAGITKDGSLTFKITYPADAAHILTGCYPYTGASPATYSSVDTRYNEPQSAQVYVVASANNTGAATVVRRTFCFAAIAGAVLTPQVTQISPAASPGSVQVPMQLTDGSATLPQKGVTMPFVDVGHIIAYTANAGGLAISVNTGMTDANGNFTATITTTHNGASGDTAVITFFAADAQTSITVKVP